MAAHVPSLTPIRMGNDRGGPSHWIWLPRHAPMLAPLMHQGWGPALLPWVAFYGLVYGTAWVLGPLLLPHCRKLDPPGRAYWASSVTSTVNSFVLTPLAWRACEQSELLSLQTSFTVSTRLSTSACVGMVSASARVRVRVRVSQALGVSNTIP